MILGFIKNKDEIKHIRNTETIGEGKPKLPLSLNETHPHEYLYREPDSIERSFRPHASLSLKMTIRKKLVSGLLSCL